MLAILGMMFMIPIPPTTGEIEARMARSIVMVLACCSWVGAISVTG